MKVFYKVTYLDEQKGVIDCLIEMSSDSILHLSPSDRFQVIRDKIKESYKDSAPYSIVSYQLYEGGK